MFLSSYCDAAQKWQLGIQDPASPILEGMISFHNYLMFFVTFIGLFVCWLLYYCIVKFKADKNRIPVIFAHISELEIIWTIIPACLLILIAIPSFSLLYSLDELIDPSLTLKVIGHQWYWSYEYSDFLSNTINSLNYDSYMIATSDLTKGAFRLLEVDNRVVLPIRTHIRLLVTASDVIHSWAVPSFGIKVDAVPGRLSQAFLFIKREGVYYGQCSEICGINHGFMPIVVKSVKKSVFERWVIRKISL
jgi:cytochrome c oxidase subunit 2